MHLCQIYVACLASYNDGILHGAWIDVNSYDDKETILEQIENLVLKTSPRPNIFQRNKEYSCRDCDANFEIPMSVYFPICPNCGSMLTTLESMPYSKSEDYAIHDSEGFYPVEIGEYEDLDYLCYLASLIDSYGEAFPAFLNYEGLKQNTYDNLKDLSIDFMNNFSGIYESEIDYTYEYCDECLDIPENVKSYFDYHKYCSDLFSNDLYSIELPSGNVAVFYT